MTILEKTVDKRQLFVTIGCALYPYAKIKELVGDKKELNFMDIMKFAMLDDEKVVAIQKLRFFSDPFNRILALRYARLTFETVSDQLAEEERTLAADALKQLESYVLGGTELDKVMETNERIRAYLRENLLNKDYITHKTRIGCLENILSVSKQTAHNAVFESSSIQRDVLGEQFAARQLQEIESLARRLHSF